MKDFSQSIFEMGISLVRAQAEQDRRERGEPLPQDPETRFPCKRCDRPSLGTGWFPFCSQYCAEHPNEMESVQ